MNSWVQLAQFTCFCTWIHWILWTNLVCVDTCLPWNHEFFTWWYIPVKPYQFWPSMTHVKLLQNSWQQAEHVYSCEYTWKHVLVERYQLCISRTCANWFRNGFLFAGKRYFKHHMHVGVQQILPLNINENTRLTNKLRYTYSGVTSPQLAHFNWKVRWTYEIVFQVTQNTAKSHHN